MDQDLIRKAAEAMHEGLRLQSRVFAFSIPEPFNTAYQKLSPSAQTIWSILAAISLGVFYEHTRAQEQKSEARSQE